MKLFLCALLVWYGAAVFPTYFTTIPPQQRNNKSRSRYTTIPYYSKHLKYCALFLALLLPVNPRAPRFSLLLLLYHSLNPSHSHHIISLAQKNTYTFILYSYYNISSDERTRIVIIMEPHSCEQIKPMVVPSVLFVHNNK